VAIMFLIQVISGYEWLGECLEGARVRLWNMRLGVGVGWLLIGKVIE
jgi:hypothetical protein